MDRRRAARQVLHRPCKLLHRPSRLYASGETQDVSDYGVLIRVGSGRPFTLGEEVDVGVAWTSEPILNESLMRRGVVMRAAKTLDGSQYVAIDFANVAALAQVA
jgi:c-di-GMP-binding flagellar brake protein YcgR